jgi:hypothetical protein
MLRKNRGAKAEMMGRKETAVWLGRALSTNEVTMRLLLQMADVISVQQQVIQALYERALSKQQGPASSESLERMDADLSTVMQKKLAGIHDQLEPILEQVDKSCRTLEGMI